METRYRQVRCILLSLVTILCPAFAGATGSADEGRIPGQYVVRLSPRGNLARVNSSLTSDQRMERISPVRTRTELLGSDSWNRTYVLHTPDSSISEEELRLQLGVTDIDFIEPVYRIDLLDYPTDSLFEQQWYLNNLGQDHLGVVGVSGPFNDTLGILPSTIGSDINLSSQYTAPDPTHRKIVVAVVDTGVDPTHPDLQGQFWNNPDEIAGNGLDDDHNGLVDDTIGYDLSGDTLSVFDIVGDNDVSDYFGHGTHIAGIIAAAQDSHGITGIAPSAEIMAVKVHPNGTTVVGAAGIVYAVNSGAHIINVSWGTAFESLILEEAVRFARDNGVLVCVAAGNSGDQRILFPGDYEESFTVGAGDAHGNVTSFSTYGSQIDLIAPGLDIMSLRAAGTDMYAESGEPLVHIVGDDDRYYLANGTSMASPMVAGAAALVWAARPHLTVDQLADHLRAGARDLLDPFARGDSLPGFDSISGNGWLDVQATLEQTSPAGMFFVSPAPATRHVGSVEIVAAPHDGYSGGWSLAYAPSGAPNVWTPVASGSTPPADSLLYTLGASAPNDFITFRLTDDFGAERFLKFSFVTDRRLELTSPLPGAEVDYNVPIAGWAHGPDYQKITLSYRLPGRALEQLYETEAEFFDSLIYGWNASGLELGECTLFAEADYDGVTLSDSVKFVIASAFATGWPRELPGRGALSPVAADLDNDGTKEIIVGTTYGLNVFSATGQPWPGFPVLPDSALTCVPAIYDVDRDGYPEIICASGQTLHVFNGDGSYVDGWPVSHDLGHLGFGTPMPIVTRLDTDRDSAIVIVSFRGDILAYTFSGDSYFYSLEGVFSSFNTERISTIYYNGNGVSGADLDGDGRNELAVTFSAERPYAGVGIFDGRTGQPAFGRDLPYVVEANGLFGTVLADLDGDKLPEVITSGYDNRGTVMLWAKKYGTQDLPGWPKVLPGMEFWLGSYPTVADLDGDGSLEVIATYWEFDVGSLYVFRADGSPYKVVEGRPEGEAYRGASTFGIPIVANLVGSDLPEVIIRSGHIIPGFGREEVHILDHGLELLPGWPIATPTPANQVFSTPYAPMVDDIDGDGLVELALVGEGLSLFVWDFEASYNDGLNVGRLFMDNTNSSTFPSERAVTSLEEEPTVSVPRSFALHQNYPNPFNPSTAISFELPSRAMVHLDVFNILGQKVTTLVDQELPAGSHTIEFDATSLASGVYLYRLSSKSDIATRKMVLVK